MHIDADANVIILLLRRLIARRSMLIIANGNGNDRPQNDRNGIRHRPIRCRSERELISPTTKSFIVFVLQHVTQLRSAGVLRK